MAMGDECPKCGAEVWQEATANRQGFRYRETPIESIVVWACASYTENGVFSEADTCLRRQLSAEKAAREAAEAACADLRRSVEAYPQATDLVRAVAKAYGYSVGSHGSRLRDLDLVAVPWTADATSAQDLADAVGKAIAAAGGPGENDLPKNYKGGPMPNGTVSPPNRNGPHGRVGYSIFLAGSYIDFAVMPKHEVAEVKEQAKP